MKLIINNETLQKEIDSEYRAKSINIYEIEFEFSSEWDDLIKRVLFIKGDQVFEGAIINNRVMMPSIPNGVYAVGVVGFISENDIITTRKSTDLCCIEITESAAEYTANQDISEEALSVFERYLEMLTNKTNEALEDIEEAKDDAINEIEEAADEYPNEALTNSEIEELIESCV